MILPQEFYKGADTLQIAKELLGKILVHESHAGTTSGCIVEVEAYCQENDPACHAAKGKTRRNEQMFGPPGHAYVYFTYGKHHCLNFVVQNEGTADAILIRALQPMDGLVLMRRRRGIADERLLCSGPGRLCQAFDVTLAHNGVSLTKHPLYVTGSDEHPGPIDTSPRIGISQGRELPWRFFSKDSVFVSRM